MTYLCDNSTHVLKIFADYVSVIITQPSQLLTIIERFSQFFSWQNNYNKNY